MVSKYRVTNCQGNILIYKQVNAFKLYQKISKKKNLLLFFIPRDNTPDHKNAVVYEEHWPADYPKAIYYGKEQPKDFFVTNRVCLCKDFHVRNIIIVLSIDEV